MFTGIITAIGTIAKIDKTGDWILTIKTPWPCDDIGGDDIAPNGIARGASIACSGVCLTVIERGDDWFQASVSAETLARTVIGKWSAGTRINLERALLVGDALDGHMVSGHVDGLAKLVAIEALGDSHGLTFEVPSALAGFIAEKGSVALDGVSLTVNKVDSNRFCVNIISHSWAHTTLAELQISGNVNLEIDMLARYVARLLQVQGAAT